VSSGPTDRPVLRAAGHRALLASAVTVLTLGLHTVHVRNASASDGSLAARSLTEAPASTHPSEPPGAHHPSYRPKLSPSPTPGATASRSASAAPSPAPSTAPPSAILSANPLGGVLVVGDSLALGSAPYLHTAFRPATVTQDLREGRGTAEGARIAAEHPGIGIIVASLGTNDDPRTQIFRPAADALVRSAEGRCLVWATVHRPGDVDGVGWSNINAIIRSEATAHTNVVVVDWAAEQAAHPSWVEGDGVHLTAAGYQARAAALASGVTRCD